MAETDVEGVVLTTKTAITCKQANGEVVSERITSQESRMNSSALSTEV